VRVVNALDEMRSLSSKENVVSASLNMRTTVVRVFSVLFDVDAVWCFCWR
jgi:hypothetical protein